MNSVLYARVSSERQADEDKVSIEEQLLAMRRLCAVRNMSIVAEFIDSERYTKTKPPGLGRRAEPSGKYDDRPQFLAMLELVKAGNIDMILVWRDDRLARHVRAYSAVVEALEIADSKRKYPVQILEATGATEDRIILMIKIGLAQRESERRNDRLHLGREGTLRSGRWPGVYNRLGYNLVREPGRRGSAIVLNEAEAETVRYIFDLADTGHSLQQIRRKLIAAGTPQKILPAHFSQKNKQRHLWSVGIIIAILRSPDYMGTTTWTFKTGETYSIDIPQIIDPTQWRRVQDGLNDRRRRYPAETIGVYGVQDLVHCGACNRRLHVTARKFSYYYPRTGEPRRQKLLSEPRYNYICSGRWQYPDEKARCKGQWNGPKLDYLVWRQLADQIMNNHNLAEQMIAAQQAEIVMDASGGLSVLAEKQARLRELQDERAWCIKMAKSGRISEAEFNKELEETLRATLDIEAEIKRLQDLKNRTSELEFETTLLKAKLEGFKEIIPDIDHTPKQLKSLSVDERRHVLERRRVVIQSLVNRVTIEPDGRLIVHVLFDPNTEQSERISLPVADSWTVDMHENE